jgi:hypothetical protein
MPARSISWKTSFLAMVGGPSSKIFWNLLAISWKTHFDEDLDGEQDLRTF